MFRHGVSEGSNEFSYGDSEDSVSISLRDLCNVQKQGEGASGKVLSIVVKKSRDIPIAVKVKYIEDFLEKQIFDL